jgi:hypothetical protein
MESACFAPVSGLIRRYDAQADIRQRVLAGEERAVY